MKTVASSSAQAKFGAMLDLAKSGEQITITQYNRPAVVMTSYDYFVAAEQALRLQAGDKMQAFLQGLPASPEAERLSEQDLNQLVQELRNDSSSSH